jgi:putative ABC transport system ATP-binding protein
MNIEVADIEVTIKNHDRVLFKISSLSIQNGEKVLIKGASGKGKTTFLHLIAGLFLPTKGSVHIGTHNITSFDDNERSLFRRQHIGMIFQKLNLLDHLTAYENVELSLLNKNSSEKILAALKAVGLNDRKNQKTALMSLGEQQRVAIARGLVGNYSIILADEPTSSLDEKNALEVTRLLLDACSEKTLIVVSHDQRIEKFFNHVLDFSEVIQ